MAKVACGRCFDTFTVKLPADRYDKPCQEEIVDVRLTTGQIEKIINALEITVSEAGFSEYGLLADELRDHYGE